MPSPSIDPGDLLDLKLMPAWVKEPSGRDDYANYTGEESPERPEHRRRPQRGPGKPPAKRMPPGRGPAPKRDDHRRRDRNDRSGSRDSRRRDRPAPQPEVPLDVAVQFLPRQAVIDNVVAQVKAETLAYSLFFLARSFLEKPQRYDVNLKAKLEAPMYQLGETGMPSVDRDFLQSNAFRLARDQFYRTDVTQSEPVKGNFASVARCRLSGTILGPTNHHDYQRKLRSFYEQRFSRRMSFPDYQRQIETVNDPAVVEQWKEQARNITTFVTLQDDPPTTLATAAEAERHFRQHYLPNLMRSVNDVTIDGITSRQLADRRLGRHIEQAWAAESRSPSGMMQELAKRFRDAGLYIFRHKRGMLFVSAVRVRPFVHENQTVSPQVNAILELLAASPRIRRKEIADKLLAEAGEDLENRKLSLASDLRWLISEGYVIEFNDGAIDLPRTKSKATQEKADMESVEADAAEMAATPSDEPMVGDSKSELSTDEIPAEQPPTDVENREGDPIPPGASPAE